MGGRSSGYAVETQELIAIFEGFSGTLPLAQRTAAKHWVEIFQIESRNSHLRENKGIQHLQLDILLQNLSVVYHSQLCDDITKKNIINELVFRGILKEKEEPPSPRIYRAPSEIDLQKFQEIISEKLDSYSALAAD